MRWIIGLGFICLTAIATLKSQDTAEAAVSSYLEEIRHDRARLRRFFKSMPKGGDLHHHFLGSIYAERLVDLLERDNYEVELNTLAVRAGGTGQGYWMRVDSLRKSGQWPALRERLLRQWSVKHYLPGATSPTEDFFSVFPLIDPLAGILVRESLLALKQRALDQNLCYLETQFETPSWRAPFPESDEISERLYILWATAPEELPAYLQTLFQRFRAREDFSFSVNRSVDSIRIRHEELGLDEEGFLFRYQNYALRTFPPARVFRDLVLAFATAEASPLIVGVNFVAPEHHPTALHDYGLHMEMFRFLREKHPSVSIALHAGELTLGQVPPEDLNWHIQAAVEAAGARRIGHGVSVPYESRIDSLLDRMIRDSIVVEVNLSSNDFLLQVSGPDHPIRLYREAGIPIVIGTDDEAVLRTDMTEQYVILAYDYPEIDYQEIKNIVFNSLQYSFLPEKGKKHLQKRLSRAFIDFESRLLQRLR